MKRERKTWTVKVKPVWVVMATPYGKPDKTAVDECFDKKADDDEWAANQNAWFRRYGDIDVALYTVHKYVPAPAKGGAE